jgi:hypothetical protein
MSGKAVVSPFWLSYTWCRVSQGHRCVVAPAHNRVIVLTQAGVMPYPPFSTSRSLLTSCSPVFCLIHGSKYGICISCTWWSYSIDQDLDTMHSLTKKNDTFIIDPYHDTEPQRTSKTKDRQQKPMKKINREPVNNSPPDPHMSAPGSHAATCTMCQSITAFELASMNHDRRRVWLRPPVLPHTRPSYSPFVCSRTDRRPSKGRAVGMS